MGYKLAFIGTRNIPAMYGGIEKSTEILSRYLHKRGYKITIFVRKYLFSGNPPDSKKKCRELNIKYIPTFNNRYLDTFTYGLLSTVYLIFSDIDFIFCWGMSLGLFTVFLKISGKKVFLGMQSVDYKRKKWNSFLSSLIKSSFLIGLSFVDRIVTVSKSFSKYIPKRYQQKIVFIPNFISPDDMTYSLNGMVSNCEIVPGDYILFIGRIVPEKGLHLLVQAYKRRKFRKRLVIVGNPFQGGRYAREIIKAIQRHKNIIFLGPVYGNYKKWLLRNAYFLILPSEIEGCSLTLLEAMSLECPVLASDIPENRSLASNYGYYFKNGVVEDLEEKMNYLINNPPQRDRIEKARRYVWENYNIERLIYKFERILNKN